MKSRIALALMASALIVGAGLPAGAEPPAAGAGVTPGSRGIPPAGAGVEPGAAGIPPAGAGVQPPPAPSFSHPGGFTPFGLAYPQAVWVPGTWYWNGIEWVWLEGHWASMY